MTWGPRPLVLSRSPKFPFLSSSTLLLFLAPSFSLFLSPLHISFIYLFLNFDVGISSGKADSITFKLPLRPPFLQGPRLTSADTPECVTQTGQGHPLHLRPLSHPTPAITIDCAPLHMRERQAHHPRRPREGSFCQRYPFLFLSPLFLLSKSSSRLPYSGNPGFLASSIVF